MENTINWNFKKAYREAGFTLEKLSIRSGITLSYLSLFSNGKYNLKQEEIERLALILDVPKDQLDGEAGQNV